jgi:archaellum component FlaC
MMSKGNYSSLSFTRLSLLIFALAVGVQGFAQKSKTTAKATANRVDACIQRNRQLTAEIGTLHQMISNNSNKLTSQEGMLNYYQSTLKSSRDSVNSIQKSYNSLVDKSSAEITALREALKDSIESFQSFKTVVMRDRQKVVRDTNVVRVYNMPSDQVRVRVLRKVLDEGIGLVIERNTDEGFLVSRTFKDRKSGGMFKKVIETRVDCDIRMVQHPYEDNRTLFYANTRVQEKQKKDKPYVELTDDKVISDYQRKLLKFFDEFLVSN